MGRMNQRLFFSILVGLVWGLGLVPAGSARAESVLAFLEADDCRKCHEREIREIESRGEKHRTAVGCLDCHVDHPPRGSEAIPACSKCHLPEANRHFTVDNCLGCHPAHRPLDIEFTRPGRMAPGCASCHPQQGQELEDYPSSHTLVDCKECHRQHGKFLECLECHEPHIPEMVYADCIGCHKPHKPMRIAYDSFVPSRFCSGCHAVQFEQLDKNDSKHHLLLCVYCHKDQHKRVPQCATCHRLPHNPRIHEKFPDCNACHDGAHTLKK